MVFLVITFCSIDKINENHFCLRSFREEFTVNVLKFVAQFDVWKRKRETNDRSHVNRWMKSESKKTDSNKAC